MTAAHDRPEDPWPQRKLTYRQSGLVELIAAYAQAHAPGSYLLTAPQIARRFRASEKDAEAALRHLVDHQLLDSRTKGNVRRGESHVDMRASGSCVRIERREIGAELECATYRRSHERVIPWIARALEVPEGTTLTVIHRLLTFDGALAAHTATILHPATGAILPRRPWLAASPPEVFARHGLTVRTAAVSAQIRPATTEAAHALGLEPGTPAIDHRELLELARGRQPIAVTTSWLHPAHYRVTLQQDTVLNSRG
ncbi:UTRA domain-containing protein [Actinospica sp. MGRD01-02]|uniref:UTRA domain-containing protein n=1 Tax=Actinospica acidithermotolerans TaxID=2828514 RepID=A0A941ECQ9_9ACTN|nr:UTRA domain-containing protein [Actinospica acidithermotolerans]MBR7828218.1 UTRA domain-containing protein [Actinospica acidithermotolerans]